MAPIWTKTKDVQVLNLLKEDPSLDAKLIKKIKGFQNSNF